MADLIYNANGGVYAPKSQEFIDGGLIAGAYYTDGTFKSWDELVADEIVTDTKISPNAFCDTTLEKIIVPNTVTSIYDSAFEGCIGLTTIIIPESVSLDCYALYGCENLTTIYYSGATHEFPWGADNATLKPYSDAIIEENSKVAVIHNYSPTRSGHTFLGWNTDNTATTATYQPEDTVNGTGESITLYAIWQKNNEQQNIFLCKDGTVYASEFIETDSGLYFDKDGKVYSPAFVVEEIKNGQFAIGNEFVALNFVEGIPADNVTYTLVDEN